MRFGSGVHRKHSGESEGMVLTFLTINESGKLSHVKISLVSNEILQEELTLGAVP